MREVLVVFLCGTVNTAKPINCMGIQQNPIVVEGSKYCSIALTVTNKEPFCEVVTGFVLKDDIPECGMRGAAAIACYCDTEMCNDGWSIMEKKFNVYVAEREGRYNRFNPCLHKAVAGKIVSSEPKGRSTTNGKRRDTTAGLPKKYFTTSKLTAY